jgi:capsule biosynthesis phosphatase
MNIIVPLGGIGKRFQEDGYTTPKPLIPVLGVPMVVASLSSLDISSKDNLFVAYKDDLEKYRFEDVVRRGLPTLNIQFVQLHNETRGAAETVLHVLMTTRINKEDPVVVVDSDNIYHDNILPVYRNKPRNLVFCHVDEGSNPIYSYIGVEGENVTDIVEKTKISKLACTGVYCFRSVETLENAILDILQNNDKQKNEFYMSGVFKHLLETGEEVKYEIISGFDSVGTPNQLKAYCHAHQSMRFCFDLDNTIVTYPEVPGDYSTVKPIRNVIDYINFLYDNGHTIIIYTARRMRTHAGNASMAEKEIGDITRKTLLSFGVKYHELHFGKPYAHFYVDDLSITPFTDMEKATGFYNIHAKPRSFNTVEMHDSYVVKTSDKINGEKHYYENIPREVSDLFPKLLSSTPKSITVSKINGVPLSFLNANCSMSPSVLRNVFSTLDRLHIIDCNPDTELDIYSNYCEKLEKRVCGYDFSSYRNFTEKYTRIFALLREYEKQKIAKIGVIHGDPVFTNILIDRNDDLKMIDMRGLVGNQLTIYGDIFYDYAKIYQSIIGYDAILAGTKVNTVYTKRNIEIFSQEVTIRYGGNMIKWIRGITNSLILSLIPIHNNSHCQDFYSLISEE